MPRKPRRVSRKIIAAVFGPFHKLVQISTLAGDSIGCFEIPRGKDPAEFMKHHGWTFVETASGEDVYAKYVDL